MFVNNEHFANTVTVGKCRMQKKMLTPREQGFGAI